MDGALDLPLNEPGRSPPMDMAGRLRRREPVRGVVAVIARRDRWLMIRRADGIAYPGAWCFPGGALKPGEDPAAALVREILEELGLTIEPGERLWRWTRDDQSLELEWWSADIVGGSLRPNSAEVQEVAWMTTRTIRATRNILPNNIEFVEFAERSGLVPAR